MRSCPPTLLAGVGLPIHEQRVLDGFDMLPTLAGESERERELMVWERLGQWAIRQRPWKLVQLRDDRGRLFHLERGSGEAEDLREAEPEVAERLLRAYLDWRREMDRAEPREPFLDF